MKLTLGVTPRDFYYIMVDEMNRFFALGLTKGESKVFAELMYAYYKVKDYSDEDKEAIITNVDNKKKMINLLNTTSAAFNNTLSRLRRKEGKKGFALIGNRINEKYMVYPDGKFSFTLNFILDNEYAKKG